MVSLLRHFYNRRVRLHVAIGFAFAFALLLTLVLGFFLALHTAKHSGGVEAPAVGIREVSVVHP